MYTLIPNLRVGLVCALRRWLAILLLGAGLPVEMQGHGEGTVYTSRSAFDAAIGSSTTATFEALTPSSPLSTGSSLIIDSGIGFTNAGTRLFITNPAGPINPIPGTGQYLWNFDSSYPVGICLPEGVTAFGADFSGGMAPPTNFNATVTATLADGQSYGFNFSGLRGSWTFWGVTFSQPVVSLVYSDGGQTWPGDPPHEEMIDNVTLYQPTPEAGPQLTIKHVGNQIVVAWPSASTGWMLQTNYDLSTGRWGNYLGPIANNTVTNTAPAGSLFFRLAQP